MKRNQIKAVMTADVISISPDLGVDIAIETMKSNDIRRLPVLSGSGRLIGIITLYEAMLAMPKFDQYNTPTGSVPSIREAMADYVYTVEPDDSISKAAEIMLHHGIGGIPVVDDRKVVGIITESDLFKFLVDELELCDPPPEDEPAT